MQVNLLLKVFVDYLMSGNSKLWWIVSKIVKGFILVKDLTYLFKYE